ncbi:hypothetical protein G647_08090 [Cladophialophora carrionii CBS 160.54]|uniref:Uncharacterized protein n=1 Tax=Cladophialophora carrionii CBS 160.54 TaxID=1279043 RepID=V9D615_9EURO|nr:uncharacterized protein G647_08090 [Cladophialophora carrionii CBS 160.54]ETI21743.1 hypothetical protein G647_08090 [Cladophialophora carrionii CBS 160.54]
MAFDKPETKDEFESLPMAISAEKPARRAWLRPAIFLTMALLVLAVLTNTLASGWSMREPQTGPDPPASCGTSAATAKARGCKYDIMMAAWLPPACYYQERSKEFLLEEQDQWYRDANLTTPMTLDELRLGDYGTAFTRSKFHLRHCIYMWIILLDGLKDKRLVDSDSLSAEHVRHCANLLVDPHGKGGLGGLGAYSRIDISILECGSPW